MNLHQTNDSTSFIWHNKKPILRFVFWQVMLNYALIKVRSKNL